MVSILGSLHTGRAVRTALWTLDNKSMQGPKGEVEPRAPSPQAEILLLCQRLCVAACDTAHCPTDRTHDASSVKQAGTKDYCFGDRSSLKETGLIFLHDCEKAGLRGLIDFGFINSCEAGRLLLGADPGPKI